MTGAPDLSPREARDRYLDKRRVDARESSLSTYHYRLKLFVEWCEDEGLESIEDLTGWDLERYETHRRSQDLAPITLQKELNTLQNFLEYCASIDLIDPQVPEKVTVPDIPRDATSSDVRLPSDRARSLIDHYRQANASASRSHVLLELAWYTGARIGGLRGLDVRDYVSNAAYVAFEHRPETDTPLKNGTDGERVVGLPDEICAVLDEYLGQNRRDTRDDHGRQPLLASREGRPQPGTIRDWMYQATIPCKHEPCPHDKDPATCEWVSYSHASQCPSSRSPHQVRTGAITWMLDCGLPVEVVAERVNASVAVIDQHYDKADPVDEMERRRRPHLDRLSLDPDHRKDDEN